MKATFQPTNKWQDVPQGAVLPSGCQVETDQKTGRIRARRAPRQPNGPAKVFDFQKAYDEAAEREPPRPLLRELPPADPFPVTALGGLLGNAAMAIQDLTLAPVALCGNSVLAVAALAVQTHVDVVLPTNMARPCSLDLLTIGETGERKSEVDRYASRPVVKREEELRKATDDERLTFENEKAVYEAERKTILGNKKLTAQAKRNQIKALSLPLPPLEPVLTADEPTVEGLVRLLAVGQPSVGLFSGEGGQFIGGYGMNQDNRLKTAANLSKFWDGETIKRVRAGDGVMVLPGRRVSFHLMCQPDVAAMMLGDPLLVSQGLLSRILLSAPDSTCGTRFSSKLRQRPDSDREIESYTARIYSILATPMPLADGKQNQLEPRRLPFASAAKRVWWAYADAIEDKIKPDGELAQIRGLASKLAEHAGRIAAVLQAVHDVNASEIAIDFLSSGIELANHYAREAQRLFLVAARNADLVLAERLLFWLRYTWSEPVVSLPDIYQRGLNAIGDAATARKLVEILEGHGWVERDDNGAMIKGVRRQTVWRLVTAE